jgi:hypothetical protein
VSATLDAEREDMTKALRLVAVSLVLCSPVAAADDTAMPELPIPLTPEEDDRLVAEGILPAITATNVVPLTHSFNFRETPVRYVMDWYADLAHVKVQGCEAVTATVTLKSDAKLSRSEALAAISNALNRANVGIYPVSDGLVEVRYINPPTNAETNRVAMEATHGGSTGRMSYAERRRLRMSATSQPNALPTPKYDSGELTKHLSEYNLEVIRAGLPPLPIPLAPEEDAKLEHERAKAAQE